MFSLILNGVRLVFSFNGVMIGFSSCLKGLIVVLLAFNCANVLNPFSSKKIVQFSVCDNMPDYLLLGLFLSNCAEIVFVEI